MFEKAASRSNRTTDLAAAAAVPVGVLDGASDSEPALYPIENARRVHVSAHFGTEPREW